MSGVSVPGPTQSVVINSSGQLGTATATAAVAGVRAGADELSTSLAAQVTNQAGQLTRQAGQLRFQARELAALRRQLRVQAMELAKDSSTASQRDRVTQLAAELAQLRRLVTQH